VLPGQHFQVYGVAYDLFRFLHEFPRATPQAVGPFSGWQFAALAAAALGTIGFHYAQQIGICCSRQACLRP